MGAIIRVFIELHDSGLNFMITTIALR